MIKQDKKILKNSFYLLVRSLFLIVVNLFTMRELLRIFGVDRYGVFSLIFGIATLFLFANSALVSAVQRYLSSMIGIKDINGLKSCFISSLKIHIMLALIISLVAFILKNYLIYEILNIGEYRKEADWVFISAIIVMFVSTIQSPLIALITSYEKMKFFSYISIIDGLLKLAMVYCVYWISFSNLLAYSIGLVIISIFVLILYLIYISREFKELKIFQKNINKDKDYSIEILSFMGWSVLGNIAWISRIQGTTFLINIFYGLLLNAAYAICLSVTNAVNTLFSSISNSVKPQIFKSYASKDIARFHYLINKATIYSVGFVVIFLLPLTLLIDEILYIWLVDTPEYTNIVFNFCAIILVLEMITNYHIAAIQATGKIKIYQIVMSILLLSNLPLIYFTQKNEMGLEYIFYSTIIIAILANIFRLLFLKIYTKYSILVFFKGVLLRLILFSTLCYYLDSLIYIEIKDFFTKFDLLLMLMNFMILVLINSLFFISCIMNGAERKYVHSKLFKLIFS